MNFIKPQKKSIQTEKAPLPIGSYSQAILTKGFLFLSGQIPIDPKTNQVVPGGIKEQTHQVMKNIGAILKEAQLNYKDIIKTLIFLKDLKTFSLMNEVYSGYFNQRNKKEEELAKKEKKHNARQTQIFPARSCVEVSNLPKEVEIEIEVIASLKSDLFTH